MLALAVAVLTIALDQATKAAVVGNLGICERIPVLGTLLRLTHIRNSGAVFGMARSAGTYFTFFSVVAAVILVVVLFFARRASVLVRVSLGLVLGGALGNLIDRLRYGAVVDFIDVGISESVRWPCFNVADSAITIGVILLILTSFARPHEEPAGAVAAGAGDRAEPGAGRALE